MNFHYRLDNSMRWKAVSRPADVQFGGESMVSVESKQMVLLLGRTANATNEG